MKKMKQYLLTHEKQYELLRYLIAGGLSTFISLLVYYTTCFVLAEKAQMSASLVSYAITSINSATPLQMSIASTLSWILSVVFAYWINKNMVFRVQSKDKKEILYSFLQFACSRLLSFLLFEQGVMLLLDLMGVPNIINRLIVLVFVMVFNYIVSKFWIFQTKN